MRVRLGHAVVALNGPWKFHIGDDTRWADPTFDDSTWETVDLTPQPGAHDSDVGLVGYVPGWQTRGHRGYFGFAWYRMRVLVDRPQGETLSLCGPFYVESAYQLFLNGRLLGSAGDFSSHIPVAYNPHLPRLFPLTQSLEFAPSENQDPVLVAVRVWMGPWALGSADTGGIQIAPALGTTEGAASLYQLQWIEMIRGYIVDAVEAVLFILLAVMVCSLIPLDRSNSAYLWLAAALVLIALRRANQAVLFWWEFETLDEFELVTVVLLVPLSLAAWTMAWCKWFRMRDHAWGTVIGVLTLLYIGSEFLSRSWFFGVLPRWAGTTAALASMCLRLLFVLLTVLIILRGMRQHGHERWLALSAILLISVGLFAQELSLLGVPGIWFPFGTGVSRTEYAYAVFDVALFALLWHRLHALFGARPNTPTCARDASPALHE